MAQVVPFPSDDPNSLIARFKASPTPSIAAPPSPMAGGIASMPMAAGAAPQLPAARIPDVIPNQAIDNVARLNQLKAQPAGVAQISNPWARGAARVLDTVASVVAPRIAEFIPGTTLGHERQIAKQEGIVANDQQIASQQQALRNQQAQEKQTEALAEYTQQRPEIEQSKIDQKQKAIRDRIAQQAAQHGQKVEFDDEGVPTFSDDTESQAFKSNQSLQQLHQSTTEKNKILTENADQKYKPGTPQYEEWHRRLDQALSAQNIALANLGLRGKEFEFSQDKFYNPQPTGQERNKADLAESAVNQVKTIRDIINRRPDLFGPGGSSKMAFQRWLSENGEDAGKFLAASNYLAEHSAGVFGGRSAYIIQQLKGITDPNFNPSTLKGALQQAEDTSKHFVEKGATHGKPGEQKVKKFNPETGRLE